MKIYLKVMTFTLGLGLALVFGSLNALFMTPNTPFFSSLVLPSFMVELHEGLCLVSYFLTAFAFSDACYFRALRKKAYLPILLFVGNTLFCLVFFRMQSIWGGLTVLTAVTALSCHVAVHFSKHTKWECIGELLLALWYIATLAYMYVVFFINR